MQDGDAAAMDDSMRYALNRLSLDEIGHVTVMPCVNTVRCMSTMKGALLRVTVYGRWIWKA